MSRGRQADSEDLFADTRMSFGDHIEELRWHLVRAIVGFAIIVHLVFIMDGIGVATGTNIGIGKPMLEFIQQPVRDSMFEYSQRRTKRALEEIKNSSKGETLNAPREMELQVDVTSLASSLAQKLKLPQPEKNDDSAEADFQKLRVKVAPYDIAGISSGALQDINNRYGLKTLSPTEAMFVYIKVAFVCGLVLSSPWVFWQIWSFVAAGLFPHEKRYINVYLPFSLGLFLAGVLTCQFLVIPNAVNALLWFNEWLDLEPDFRLNEWLTFAIMMPVIFGISFQTPLVMLFLERLGFVSIETYRKKRLYAYFGLGFFGALVNPSADFISQFFLLIPLFLLYELGIWLCKLTARHDSDVDVPDSQEMVEV
jgi:sec-independent protein translocase protein TatC